MATNNFKAFALDPNANVTPQANWEALPALLSGFTAGKASSAQVNKALRQATTIGAMVGQFIANSGADALDNGDVDGLVTKFTNALITNLGFQKGIAGGISWTKVNGVLEIWGKATVPLGGVTITLPVAMPDIDYTIIATDSDVSVGQGALIVGTQISTTQIHLHALKQGSSVFVNASAGEVFFNVKSKVSL